MRKRKWFTDLNKEELGTLMENMVTGTGSLGNLRLSRELGLPREDLRIIYRLADNRRAELWSATVGARRVYQIIQVKLFRQLSTCGKDQFKVDITDPDYGVSDPAKFTIPSYLS